MVKQIAYFGGSFNPIHWGHLSILDSLIKNPQYEYVIIVPCFFPYYKKQNASSLNPQQILHTLKILKEHLNSPKIIISLIDYYKKLEGKTILHLEHLVNQCDQTLHQSNFSIVLGEDNLTHQTKWFQIEKIQKDTFFHIITRPIEQAVTLETPKTHLQLQKRITSIGIQKYSIYPKIQFLISSSKIRNTMFQMIQENKQNTLISWIQEQMRQDNFIDPQLQVIITKIYQYIKQSIHLNHHL